MSKKELTVVILTYNEEMHIARCITSLLPVASNIIVVDSYSTDSTVAICNSFNVKIFQREWKNYADQFQWALDNGGIDTEWVMRLDADEYLDNEMQRYLFDSLMVVPESTSGLICSLRNVYLGKTIRFGGYDPLKLLRIWRYGKGRIESRWMDEHIVLSEGDIIPIPGQILHNNLNNHRWWTDKHNKYADREMVDILADKYGLIACDKEIFETDNGSAKVKRFLKEKVYNNLPVFVRPVLYFLFRYVICFGFLDGKEGFAYHFSQALWYRTLVDIRVVEAEKLLRLASDNDQRLAILEKLTGLSLK